ncbi:kinase-like domain-containing protein [Suillus americanus]|nr:kinase-like domain-containing protein [Suillus americanus]
MHNGALDGYLERTSLTLSMEQKLKLLKQVVDGLGYLHEQDVIHGDLTSTNVVIDRDGNAFLTDFGLWVALAEADRSYHQPYSEGAVRWSAPELIIPLESESIPDGSNNDADLPKPNSQSDVFSLGCIMLHVFSGRPPFWWLGDVQLVFRAQFDRIEPYWIEPSVIINPRHLDFMRRCWSAKPEDRPSTGDAASFVEHELGRAARFRDTFFAPTQQISNSGYGNEFRADDTNCTPRRSADPSSPLDLRNLFGFLRSSTRPTNASLSIRLPPRRLNVSFFPVRVSRRPADVAPCREEDRYGITPESDAEAAAAMQRMNSNNADISMQQVQGVAGAQGSQGRGAQGQSSDFEAGKPLIGCCGFYLVRRRPAPN